MILLHNKQTENSRSVLLSVHQVQLGSLGGVSRLGSLVPPCFSSINAKAFQSTLTNTIADISSAKAKLRSRPVSVPDPSVIHGEHGGRQLLLGQTAICLQQLIMPAGPALGVTVRI